MTGIERLFSDHELAAMPTLPPEEDAVGIIKMIANGGLIQFSEAQSANDFVAEATHPLWTSTAEPGSQLTVGILLRMELAFLLCVPASSTHEEFFAAIERLRATLHFVDGAQERLARLIAAESQ